MSPLSGCMKFAGHVGLVCHKWETTLPWVCSPKSVVAKFDNVQRNTLDFLNVQYIYFLQSWVASLFAIWIIDKLSCWKALCSNECEVIIDSTLLRIFLHSLGHLFIKCHMFKWQKASGLLFRLCVLIWYEFSIAILFRGSNMHIHS